MAPDLIPPAAWGAVGGVIAGFMGAAATLWAVGVPARLQARIAARRDTRDSIQQDAVYWKTRAKEADADRDTARAEKEVLYDRNQTLHEQVERLLHVNDAVMEHSQSVRTEVVNALPASTGPSDARLTP